MAERCITLLACANPIVFIFRSPMDWVRAVPRRPACRQAGIATYEVQDDRTHRTVVDKLTVGDDVLQVSHQAQLKEHNRAEALLAALPIITFDFRSAIINKAFFR